MLQRFLAIAIVITGLALPGLAASDREDDISRIHASARVFHDIMNTHDKAIPQELLESAKCIAIIPGEKKPCDSTTERLIAASTKGLPHCRRRA
jgi:hypothetical protein